MKSYAVEGVVLRMRPLGEADRILTLFSRERGKLRAVAKGARKTQSKFGARLDFFSRASLLLRSGKSLDVISSVRSLKSMWNELVDPDTYAAASYLAEAIDELCEPDLAVPELYQMLCEFQDAVLAHADRDVLLAAADLRILSALGFSPELDACALCGTALGKRPLSGGRARLSPQACGLLCGACVRQMRSDPAATATSGGILSLSAADFEDLRALRAARLTALPAVANGAALHRLTRTFVEYQMGRRSKALAVSGAGSRLRRATARKA